MCLVLVPVEGFLLLQVFRVISLRLYHLSVFYILVIVMPNKRYNVRKRSFTHTWNRSTEMIAKTPGFGGGWWSIIDEVCNATVSHKFSIEVAWTGLGYIASDRSQNRSTVSTVSPYQHNPSNPFLVWCCLDEKCAPKKRFRLEGLPLFFGRGPA